MCCRYYADLSPELRPYIEAANNSSLTIKFRKDLGKPLTIEGEIFPSMVVPVLATGRSGRKTAFPMKWGYTVPGLKRTVVNARSESAAVKQSFSDSWNSHRCIIPASCYFEWEHPFSPEGRKKIGDKYEIRPAGGNLTYLAGLYRIENGLPEFVVLTKAPEANLFFIHDRMPLIFPPELTDAWIDPHADPKALLPFAEKNMVYKKIMN